MAKHGRYAIAFGAPNASVGGKIVSRSVSGNTMTLLLGIDAGSAQSGVVLTVASTCNQRPFTVSLSVINLDADGGGPTVTVDVSTY